MPGIVGFIGAGRPEESDAALQQMMGCMLHERFYVSGSYSNERLGLWAGWVSHEGSFSDSMPLWNATKDICVIFSGEDFMDAGEIARLRAKGHQCCSGNAGYLVHLYEETGLRFIERLNGRFSGLVIDLRERSVVLFNDRYGQGRVYYHENAAGFYFSSEAKSLLKVLPGLRRLDLESLGEVFSVGCVLQNRTLFSGIALLPGGSRWTFAGKGQVKKESYFDRALWENQPLLSGAEYYEKLKETFARILPKYFLGRERVAMSLTGGLDGRMIMAWANPPPGGLPCYTFGGIYRDCTDVRIAQRVAKLCRQSHETIVVESKFLTEFPDLAEKAVYVSDGTMDVTGAVELYVNKIARRIAPVRLTGNYGSEMLRGNVAFGPRSIREEFFEQDFARLMRIGATTYRRERQGHPVSFIAFKQVPWHHHSRLAVELSQLTARSPYLDNELVALMYQAPPDLVASQKPSFRLIADGNLDLARIPTDRGLLYPPIPVVTRCHHAYEEFTFMAEYAYDYGMPQWLVGIDHVLAPLRLEKMILGRHKFYHFRVWYRDRFSQYLKDILLDSRARNRPYINGRLLEEMVKKHIQGTRNYTSEIHRILTAELIQRQLVEQH